LLLLPVGLAEPAKSFAAQAGANTPRLSLPLDGLWQFRLDPKNEGTENDPRVRESPVVVLVQLFQ
jgi:hypothetical protein